MKPHTNSILDILPTEILIEILSYMEYDDLKMARFVCKPFEQILEEPFINRSCLKLDYEKDFKLDPTNESCNIVFKTNKSFKHITFNDYEYESHFDPRFEHMYEHNFDAAPNPNITEFFNLYCDSIVTLRLKNCLFSEEHLLEFLPRLKKLKAFELGGPNYTVSSAKIIACLISTVETLTFTSPIRINRDVIENIPKDVYPTITELNLSVGDNIFDDNDNLPFWHSGVFAVLKRLKVSLRKFSVGCVRLIPDTGLLQGLNEIGLKLESLKFVTTTKINDAQFEKFTKLMCNLKHLSITAMQMTDDHAKMICDNMTELRTLRYSLCYSLGDEGVKYAANLKHLETFEIDDCQLVYPIRRSLKALSIN